MKETAVRARSGMSSTDLEQAWPTAELVHLLIHESWSNQVEIYFSIVQRKAINPGNFRDLDHLAERVLGFEDRYKATAGPFAWNHCSDDLNSFLTRLDKDETTPHAA